MNMNWSISESNSVLQISQSPYIAQKWFCIKNFHMDLSFQKKKKRFKNLFLGSREIKQILFMHFFLNTLYMTMVSTLNLNPNFSFIIQPLLREAFNKKA